MTSKRQIALFLTAAAALLAFVASLPVGALFSADAGPKYWQTIAFAGGESDFDYPAAELDPERRHVPRFTLAKGDRLVSIYPVLFPLLAAPALAVGGDALLRTLPLVAGLLTAWCAGLLAARLRGEPIAGLAAAVCLAATPLVFYSATFWEHSLATLMVVGAAILVVSADPPWRAAPWRWAAAGALIGVGAWVRTEVLFLAPLLLLPLWRAPRAGAAGVAGVGAGVALAAFIQRVTIGGWLPLHVVYHASSSAGRRPFVISRIESIQSIVASDWVTGLAGALWLAAVAAVLIPSWRRRTATLGLGLAATAACVCAAFAAPAVRWFGGIRPTEAFPFAAPAATWIVLAALPIVLWGQPAARLRDLRRWLLAGAAVWLAVTLIVARAVRALEWGTRYLLPSVVLLTVLLCSLPLADGRWRRLRMLAVTASVVAALVVQGLGLALLRHGVRTHDALRAAVLEHTESDKPVVSDAYLVPLLAGRAWSERRFLYCTSEHGLERLAAEFGRHDVERWSFVTVDRVPGAGIAIPPKLERGGGARWVKVADRQLQTGSRRVRIVTYE